MKVTTASATIQPDDLRHHVHEQAFDFVQLLALFGRGILHKFGNLGSGRRNGRPGDVTVGQ